MIIRKISITIAIFSIIFNCITLDFDDIIIFAIAIFMLIAEMKLYQTFKKNLKDSNIDEAKKEVISEELKQINYSIFESKIYAAAYFIMAAGLTISLVCDLLINFVL